jgi:D-tyrosyl-tRNA(Tyr) deacylase
LYDHAVSLLRDKGLNVATGEFQAYMQVTLQNDGPVTLMLDSADRNRPRRG